MGLGRAGRAYGKERVCALPGGALSQPRAQTLSQTPLGPNTEIQLTLAMQTADGRAPCFHAGGVGVLPTPSSVARAPSRPFSAAILSLSSQGWGQAGSLATQQGPEPTYGMVRPCGR